MNAIRDVERAAEVVVPGLVPARLIVYAVLGLIAAIVVGFLIWWFFVHPAHQKAALAQSHVETKAAEAVVEKAKDAQATGDRVQIVHDTIERITRENTTRIMSAQGAGDPLPPAVDSAWIAGLCLRAGARGQSACDPVPRDAAGISDGADTLDADSVRDGSR